MGTTNDKRYLLECRFMTFTRLNIVRSTVPATNFTAIAIKPRKITAYEQTF